jgi:hypothetical protein
MNDSAIVIRRKTRFGTYAVGAVFIMLSGLIAHFLGVSASRSPVNPHDVDPELVEILAPSLDFGEVYSQADFTWPIRVQNRAAYPVTLVDLATSCGCTQSLADPVPLPPGAVTEVSLALNLAAPGGSADPDAWDMALKLTPLLQEDAPQDKSRLMRGKTFDFRGRVKRLFRATPAKVDFGQSLVIGAPFEPCTIEIQFAAPVREVSAHCDLDFLVAVPKQSDSDFTITITPVAERLRAGSFASQLHVAAKWADGSAAPPVAIPVLATVVYDVYPTPPAVLLGPIDVDVWNPIPCSVRFVSQTGSGFEIVAVKSESSSAKIKECGERHVELTITAIEEGDCSASIDIQLRSVVSGDYQVTLPVRWFGRRLASAAPHAL